MRADVAFESLEPRRKAVVFAFLFAAIWYLTWRLGTINRQALIFSWLLYGAELYGLWTTSMHLFMTWRLTVRESPQPPDGLSVDVFVPTINEPASLVRKTLLAVANMDYPHVTWLLDDGRRPEMERLARELGCRYLARPDNRDAKAGNMNNALLHSNGEFIVVFDADHAPKRSFLTRTLGYFRDPGVAFVQTPQDFYNLDSFQHRHRRHGAGAWHEQSVFFRVIQRGKDYWNAAFFCGSCAVIRRSALESIGGFAVGTVTEDLHTSLKIHKKGYRSVYHAESLAFGLAPSEGGSFLNQRIRWGQGAMQVWRKEGVFFCRGLTMAQRVNYLASSITYFDGWHKGFFYLIPAIVLVTGVMPIVSFGREFLLHFVPYFLLTFWAFEEVNRGYGRSLVIEQYNMTRFAAMAWSTFAIFKDRIKFRVTPKGTAPAAAIPRFLAPQAVVMALNVLAILVGALLYREQHHLPQSALIANIVWASVNSGLAIAVLRFGARHAGYHRKEYRFPIPLPAMVEFSNGKKLAGTIDDVSSAGCRIYVAAPAETEPGAEVGGTIFLPSGTVDFKAEVRTLTESESGGERYVKSIGCSFLGAEGLDKLDLYLYGSDLERRIDRLSEVVRTPLDLLLGGGREAEEGGHATWNAVTFASSDAAKTNVGLISLVRDCGRPASLLAYAPIPEGTRLAVNVYGHREVFALTGSVGGGRTIETPLSPLFNYQFVPVQGGAA